MHKYIRFLTGLMNEVSGRVEVKTEIVILMVLPRDVESEWDALLRMLYVNVFAGCQDGANLMFCIRSKILFKVSGF